LRVLHRRKIKHTMRQSASGSLSRFRRTRVLRSPITACAFAFSASLLAFSGQPASAQNTPSLLLTPSMTSASVGQTVVFTLALQDGANDGSNLFGYDANILLNTAYLQFVSTTPYTGTFSGFSDAQNTNNTFSNNNSDLRITFETGNNSPLVNNQNQTTALGMFSVKVISALPAGGTQITIGSPAADPNAGGSSVIDGTTFANVLKSVQPATLTPPAAAPEPSGLLVAVLGAAGLSLRVWRKRRTA